jgi:hypothetical protein
MTVEQSATFLVGSILTGLGFIIVFGVIIAINNIFHKYWKPVQIVKWFDAPSVRFATEDEVKKLDPK